MFKGKRESHKYHYNRTIFYSSELMLLFPNVAQKPHSAHEKPLERTLAIIRPSALKVFKGLNKINNNRCFFKMNFRMFRCNYSTNSG